MVRIWYVIKFTMFKHHLKFKCIKKFHSFFMIFKICFSRMAQKKIKNEKNTYSFSPATSHQYCWSGVWTVLEFSPLLFFHGWLPDSPLLLFFFFFFFLNWEIDSLTFLDLISSLSVFGFYYYKPTSCCPLKRQIHNI